MSCKNLGGLFSLAGIAGVVATMLANGVRLAAEPQAVNMPLQGPWLTFWAPIYAAFFILAFAGLAVACISRKA